jgi:hypothetical protein
LKVAGSSSGNIAWLGPTLDHSTRANNAARSALDKTANNGSSWRLAKRFAAGAAFDDAALVDARALMAC